MNMKYWQFIKSALKHDSDLLALSKVKKWLYEVNKHIDINISKINISDLENWSIDKQIGVLRHDSGKYFSIGGIDVKTNWGKTLAWQQPIILQPEIGILGLIAKEINGVLHFLMQAKIEPGNINKVQLSPTLQATKSNYTQVHKGKKPLYLDYFLERSKYDVLLDQLQSEQGARFLKKRNRNIIIKVEGDIPVYDDFAWLTLWQIKQLISESNIVNMDTRTVISGIPFGNYSTETLELIKSLNSNNFKGFNGGMLKSALDNECNLFTLDELIAWFTNLKAMTDLQVAQIKLHEISNWIVDDCCIRHVDGKYFKVIGAKVEISTREVQSWSQPMIQPSQEGLIAFIVKKINGVYHFLIQAKLECGNFDLLEMAPTVQCLTGNYHETPKGCLPFLEYVLNANEHRIRYDSYQSEEGGRFFQEQNRNLIIEAEEDFPNDVPENYIWMTLNQLAYFIKFNNYLNIQARSLISAIQFI